jgi:hypothetical protein
MTTLNMEFKGRENTALDDTDLELVSGGERTLFENLHRLWFAATCVISGNTLEVKGDQLQCHGHG